METPGRLLLRAVRILLECILVCHSSACPRISSFFPKLNGSCGEKFGCENKIGSIKFIHLLANLTGFIVGLGKRSCVSGRTKRLYQKSTIAVEK